MGATVGSLFAFPKTYHVETKALAQTNSALMVRGDGPSADSLTRVAAETVLRRDNLLALIQQTDLLRYTREHRAPVQRARDAIVKALHAREDSEADQLDALVKPLEKKLAVWTSDRNAWKHGDDRDRLERRADGLPSGGRRAAGLSRRPLRTGDDGSGGVHRDPAQATRPA